MKKTIGWLVIIMFTLAPLAGAAMYTGALTVANGGLSAGLDWNAPTTSFSWVVNDTSNPGNWTYEYTWNTASKDLSHIDIEVSGNFTAGDLISWSANKTMLPSMPEGPKTLSEKYGSLFGLKWELGQDTTSLVLTLVTNRMPMWGDIYAKDGISGDVYAVNTGFGSENSNPIGNDPFNKGKGWAMVPDTVVPIPAAAWLLGSGIVGLVAIRRRVKP